MIGTLSGPWLILVALFALGFVVRRAPRPARGDLSLAAALFVVAAAARFAFGFWGPLHINGQGPLWIRGALDPEALAGYGPGYFELFGWVALLSAPPDSAIFAVNALLSALSPALLYLTARVAGVSRSGALIAAGIMAGDAVLARNAATEGYFSSLIAVVLAVQAALALALEYGSLLPLWGGGSGAVNLDISSEALRRADDHPPSVPRIADAKKRSTS